MACDQSLSLTSSLQSSKRSARSGRLARKRRKMLARPRTTVRGRLWVGKVSTAMLPMARHRHPPAPSIRRACVSCHPLAILPLAVLSRVAILPAPRVCQPTPTDSQYRATLLIPHPLTPTAPRWGTHNSVSRPTAMLGQTSRSPLLQTLKATATTARNRLDRAQLPYEPRTRLRLLEHRDHFALPGGSGGNGIMSGSHCRD